MWQAYQLQGYEEQRVQYNGEEGRVREEERVKQENKTEQEETQDSVSKHVEIFIKR